MNLKQLAKELNLSFSTVSKALRDSHEISVATKNYVQVKAKELNFQVNPFASSLRSQNNKTIAVVIPEVTNDFFGPVINGIESLAIEKGYHLSIYLTHDEIQKEIMNPTLVDFFHDSLNNEEMEKKYNILSLEALAYLSIYGKIKQKIISSPHLIETC